MNKNQSGLPGFITGYHGPSTSSSRDFQMLVKGIGESKSRLVSLALSLFFLSNC